MSKKNDQTLPISPGRKKLASLGINLPLLPTTTVGSFPLQQELKEMRFKVSRGVQQASDLERREKLAVDHWISIQEKLGLDIFVDGEVNRGDFIGFFAKKISGFTPGGTVRVFGNRYYKKPIIASRLEWKEPITQPMWHYAQRLTHKPVKAIVTGPYTLLTWSFNEYYPSKETALIDLTKIIRREIQTLVDSGAKIIQIDEPALSTQPDDFPLILDSLKEITAGFKSYFILHHCYGNLAEVWDKMQRIPVDNFDLETTNVPVSLSTLFKKFPTKKDVSFGVIDSHSARIESPRLVGDRIREAAKTIPASQLWISPDCGLKTRTSDQVTEKLTVMIDTVKKFRKK